MDLETFLQRRQVKLIDNRKKVICAKLDNTVYFKIEFVLIILFLLMFTNLIMYKLIYKHFRYIEAFILILIFEKIIFDFSEIQFFFLKIPVSSLENDMAPL